MDDEVRRSVTLGKELADYGWLTWAWVVGLSFWGGAANFFRKLRQGKARPFNVVELIGEIFVSGFTGVCTFLLCTSAGFDPLMSSALVAIAGHMGPRALFQFEQMAMKKLGLDASEEDPKP